MSDAGDPTRAVWEVLCDLNEVVHVRDMCRNGGLTGSPDEVSHTWAHLEEALRTAADVTERPQPGQGLRSLWLREVHHRAEEVEAIVETKANGWSDVLNIGNGDLEWMVTHGLQLGSRVLYFASRQVRGIRSIRRRTNPPLEQLRQLAAEVSDEDLNSSMGQRRVGELILEAVDELAVANELLGDGAFRNHIIKNLDFPSAIAVPPYLEEMTDEGVVKLIEMLEHWCSGTVESSVPDCHSSEPVIDLEELARVTERLDRINGKWVSNRKAAYIEVVDTATLAKYRRAGYSTPDERFGRDIHGRIWRRDGTDHSHPWYLRHTLKAAD